MTSSRLLIDSCTILVTAGGLPESEYALFDAGDVELRATSPGTIREVAYRTTVGRAVARLRTAGVTPKLAEEAAASFLTSLREEYARGDLARRLARRLEAAELFAGGTYDADLRRYAGTWMRLGALSVDCKLLRATTAFQALHLVAVLAECDPKAPLVLDTSDVMMERRPGERSFRRAAVDHAASVPDAMERLARERPSGRTSRPQARVSDPPAGPPSGPDAGRASRLEELGVRMTLAMDAGVRERLEELARAMRTREQPKRGPFASSDVWELELALSMGDTHVEERIAAIERTRGKLPATAYLRARAALLAETEPAAQVAEKATAMVEAMAGFHEARLLAAVAWKRAGDSRRALAFAQDLAGDPHAPEDLRREAEEVASSVLSRPSLESRASLVPRASVPPGETHGAPLRPSVIPPPPSAPALSRERGGSAVSGTLPPPAAAPPPAEFVQTTSIQDKPLAWLGSGPVRKSMVPPPNLSNERSSLRSPAGMPAPRVTRVSMPPPPPGPEAAPHARQPSAPPPSVVPPTLDDPMRLRPSKPPLSPNPQVPNGELFSIESAALASPRLPRLSGPPAPAGFSTIRMPSVAPPAPVPPQSASREPTSARGSVLPPPQNPVDVYATLDPQSHGESGQAARAPRTGGGISLAAPPPARMPTLPPPPEGAMRGASQPPFQAADPEAMGAHGTSGPDPSAGALLAQLPLPAGLEDVLPPSQPSPRTAEEARVLCTLWCRELAHDYAKMYGVDLCFDTATLEHLQRHLQSRFPYRALLSEDDTREARRHGAYIAEFLARRLGAYWTDVSAEEPGYWAMCVPPATRVLPFGRVLRYISLGTQERDLVSYCLELEMRSR